MGKTPTRTSEHPHIAAAEQYAKDVLSGEVPACKWVRLAAQRQMRDLERQGGPGFPFWFDRDGAERAIRFMEQLPHVKGPKANRGETFVLEPHQAWFYTTLLGWKRSSGARRFNRAYREMPRGNGKSFECAAIGNYLAFAEGEQGAEVYSAATKRDQAKIVWEPAKRMLRKAPDLTEALGVELNAHALYQPSSGSVFLPLSSDHDTLDGLNVYAAIIDELHAHPTRGLYDVLETAISKRDQALLLMITTAGSDRTGICYEVRSDLCSILEGVADDDALFGVIYTTDEGDDWRSEETWRKANPNWGVSVNPETFRTLASKAERIPSSRGAFLTKHLDVWVSVNSALFDVEKWHACADTTMTRDQFSDWSKIMGLDLANKNDVASRADVYWQLREDGKEEVAVFWSHYTNREAVDAARNASMPGWELTGHLQVHDGNSTSQALIEEDIVETARRYGFDTLALDKYEGDYMTERLQARGLTEVVVVPMNVQNLSKPTKMLQDLILEQRIKHNGDPVAAWHVSNVVGHFDKNDNVFPHKETPDKKIDGAIALIVALSIVARRIGVGMTDAALSAHFAQNGVTFV